MLLLFYYRSKFYFSSNKIKGEVAGLGRAETRLVLALKIENDFSGAIGAARAYMLYGYDQMIQQYQDK